jgi:hypothetical protein
MVLIEHLPLLGLALGLAHLHHGRVTHSHPPHLNQASVPLISDGSSQLHQAPPPKLIAARASDESHETTIQVTQTHLQGILDRIKSLEAEIASMMASSKANSSLDSSSTPVQHSALDPDDIEFSKSTLAAMKSSKPAATTRQETKSTPAGKPFLDPVTTAMCQPLTRLSGSYPWGTVQRGFRQFAVHNHSHVDDFYHAHGHHCADDSSHINHNLKYSCKSEF